MIRVYLDWNVFSYLYNFRETKEPYISLNRTLVSQKNNLLIPYSSAHLSDLVVSYNKSEKGKVKTIENLDYLAELTNHHCILHDAIKNKTYPDNYNIQDYFQQLLENDNLLSANAVDDLFKGMEMDGLLSAMMNIFKLMPSGMKHIKPETTLPEPSVLNDMHKGFTESSSFYELMNETLKLTNKYNTEPAYYRSIRNISLEELHISNDYTQASDPLNELDKALQSSAFQKTFIEFAETNLKNYFGNKAPSKFDIFTNYYIILDFLGYYRDKVFKNMLQDSFHAYYGAHCDFFVTDDDNTYHKAKAIYKHFNIKTIVCKSQQFVTEFYGKSILSNIEIKPVTEIIPEIISNSFILKSTLDDNLNPVEIYKTGHYVFSYFNRLQLTRNPDNSLAIYLYKKNENYSTFYFYEEIKTITNKIVAEFGIDLNLRSDYIREVDTAELKKNKWKGRIWKFGKRTIELNMEESSFGLMLSIHLN